MSVTLSNDRARQAAQAIAFAILVKHRDSDGKLMPFTWLSILRELSPASADEVVSIITK